MIDPAHDAYEHRRSSRVLISIPVVISGEAHGVAFESRGETVIVSRYGCKLRTNAALHHSMEVRVGIPGTGRWCVGRVVWVDAENPGEYGIALATAENLWGIQFPPADRDAGGSGK